MYPIEYTEPAARVLRKMPGNIVVTIRSRIEALAIDPYAPNNNVIRLKGSADYRLRVGDWRVVYSLEDSRLVIVIVRIAREDASMTKPQIIESDGKPAFVVLPYDEWQRIERLIEDAEDNAALDAYHANPGRTLPADVVDALVDGKNPVRVFPRAPRNDDGGACGALRYRHSLSQPNRNREAQSRDRRA